LKSSDPTIIIAEAGVNHNGSLERALEMVDVAASAGADFIKFQSFRATRLVTKNAEKAQYQIANTSSDETQFEMLKALELNKDEHLKLLERCSQKNIKFLSTAFDHIGLKFLSDELKLPTIKISSGDLTNPLILLQASWSAKQIILSTGMANLAEIRDALSIMAYGYYSHDYPKTKDECAVAWNNKMARQKVLDQVSLLHCTTEYPTPFEEVNLNVMNELRENFGISVGYSDHTVGTLVPVAAVAQGAKIIEKHFTLDKRLPGPDHKASLEPEELKDMVEKIRITEKLGGSKIKKPVASEIKNIPIARKSIVAAKKIKAGDNFSLDNLTVKRPGDGICPFEIWDLIGQQSEKNYNEDEKIAVVSK